MSHTPHPLTLRVARERRELSLRSVAKGAAQRLGSPDRAAAILHVLSRIERGTSSRTHVERPVLDAVAAELALVTEDLFEAPLWAFQTAAGPSTLGITLPLFSEPMRVYEARGVLTQDDGAVPAVLADAELVVMFASDRERWIEQNLGELDDHERDFAVIVDPDARTLRALWLLHVATTSSKPAARQRAVEALRDFGRAGVLGTVDFDGLHHIALKRLRLVDVPTGTYDRWVLEEQNLAAAQRLALRLDRVALGT